MERRQNERLSLAELFELQKQTPSNNTMYTLVARVTELLCFPSRNGDFQQLLLLRSQYPEILAVVMSKALTGISPDVIAGDIRTFLNLYKRFTAARLPAWELEEALLEIREEAKAQSLSGDSEEAKDGASETLQAFANEGLVGTFATLAKRRKPQ